MENIWTQPFGVGLCNSHKSSQQTFPDIEILEKLPCRKIVLNWNSHTFSHTLQSEITIGNIYNLPTPNFKKTSTWQWVSTKQSENILDEEFFSYVENFNLLINYRKSELLYPFHYFGKVKVAQNQSQLTIFNHCPFKRTIFNIFKNQKNGTRNYYQHWLY